MRQLHDLRSACSSCCLSRSGLLSGRRCRLRSRRSCSIRCSLTGTGGTLELTNDVTKIAHNVLKIWGLARSTSWSTRGATHQVVQHVCKGRRRTACATRRSTKASSRNREREASRRTSSRSTWHPHASCRVRLRARTRSACRPLNKMHRLIVLFDIITELLGVLEHLSLVQKPLPFDCNTRHHGQFRLQSLN